MPLGPLAAECRRLAAALAQAERDREHLAYDLHDSVLQELTAAALLLEGAQQQATFQSDQSRENFSGGLRLLREAIAEARRLIRAATIIASADQSLSAALNQLVSKVRSDLQLPATFHGADNVPEPPSSVKHMLLRIVQESLYNAWKHAKATQVEVALSQNDDCLELTIADNGIGFDPAHVRPGHFGLDSIRARARALGADLVFDTAPHHGTRVCLRLNRYQL